VAVAFRGFCCGRCRMQCFACGACDKNRAYCQVCSPIRRAETVRIARQTHAKSDAGKADHRDHQRAYRARKRLARLLASTLSRRPVFEPAAQSVMDLSAKNLPFGLGCALPPALVDFALQSVAVGDGVTNAQSKYARSNSPRPAAVPDMGANSSSNGSAGGVAPQEDAPSGVQLVAKAYPTTTPQPAVCCSFCGRQGQRVCPDAFRGTRRPRSKSAVSDRRRCKFTRIPAVERPD